MVCKQKALVACMGNLLMKDEGFGPYVFKVLTDRDAALEHFGAAHADFLMHTFRGDQAAGSAAGIDDAGDGRIPVMDGATMGMSFVPYIERYDRIVLVDIIDCGEGSGVAPGTVYVLTPEDMAEHTVLHSLHDLRLVDVIANAALAGHTSDISCVCVQKLDAEPDDFEIGVTEPLREAVPTVVGCILRELGLDADAAVTPSRG